MLLNIKIPIPTLEEAYILFIQNISRIDWYETHDRPYFLNTLHQMKKIVIDQMINERELLITDKRKYIEKFKESFKNELYRPDRYKRISDEILLFSAVFDKIYEKFQVLNDSWGFKIWDVYTIDLNMYVGNGSYNANTGHILLGIKGGGIQINMATIKTIMHEMIHLGIEKLIVQNLLLQQEEKERVVDNLCQYVGSNIFNDNLLQYQFITEKCSYMDKFCIGQPQKNLVKEIQKGYKILR